MVKEQSTCCKINVQHKQTLQYIDRANAQRYKSDPNSLCVTEKQKATLEGITLNFKHFQDIS